MPLVLNIRKSEGFWVVNQRGQEPDTRYIVETIFDSEEFVLRKENTDLAYKIGNEVKTLPDGINIRSGATSRHSARVLIDAPWYLKILRDKLYHASQNY